MKSVNKLRARLQESGAACFTVVTNTKGMDFFVSKHVFRGKHYRTSKPEGVEKRPWIKK